MMQFAHRHINTSEKIIRDYDGSMPLPHFLKQFFAADKKYGSKDRKAIAHACYCYYRLGHALNDIPVKEKIQAGIFLCSDEPGTWQKAYPEHWLSNWSKDIEQRISFLNTELRFSITSIFPLHEHLDEEIDRHHFFLSHLIQPDLHLRTRPGRRSKVIDALETGGIQYDSCGENCLALPNSSRIDNLIDLDKDAVVQDLSSQRIAEFLATIRSQSPKLRVWDCCAASGGKSILATDILGSIDLTVSDVRSSILQNLKKRFAEAGIRNYRSFVTDLSESAMQVKGKYDLVICDVPCTGSGTWGRTPEQLSFFDEKKIFYYTELQRRITKNVIPAVAANGYFLYITCSVFREENEDIVEFIKAHSSLQLCRMDVLKGYDKKADTMFAALFTAS